MQVTAVRENPLKISNTLTNETLIKLLLQITKGLFFLSPHTESSRERRGSEISHQAVSCHVFVPPQRPKKNEAFTS